MSFHLVTKKRVLVIFLIFVFIISLVYLNLNYIQQNYENARWSSERCFNELTSIKYQLNGKFEELLRAIYIINM